MRSRRLRPAMLAVIAVAAALLALLLTTRPSGRPLDPEGTGAVGAAALAAVLADQGVDVDPVAGTLALNDLDTGPGTTVLVTGTAYLTAESGEQLLAATARADRLVVVVDRPATDLRTTLGVDAVAAPGTRLPLEPECDSPLVEDGDVVSTWDVLLGAKGEDRAAVEACYPPSPSHNLGGARDAALLTYPATSARAPLTLAGLGPALTNARVDEEANAAVAMRLLGGSPRLLWVTPQPLDAAASPQGVWDVLPRNLTASAFLLAAAVLALMLVRGRRLGPVVAEPLPVVVRASETTRARGRLYRQAHDRRHALAALQEGARRRLRAHLGLPPSADDEALVVALADETGEPADQLRALLLDPDVGDDVALADRARRLRRL